MSDETTTDAGSEETVEPTTAEAEDEAYVEPEEVGETGVLEGGGAVGGEGVTTGVTDDLRVLNERMGYPITEEEGEAPEVEGQEAGDGEDESSGDDQAVPTEDSTVAEIKAYLDSEGIAYTSSQTKAELLELV